MSIFTDSKNRRNFTLMASVIRLPKFGHTMQEGIIVSIFVAEGTRIEKGDRVAEVETNKTTLEIESTESGFLKRILVEVGQSVNINSAIMIVGEEDEQISDEFIDSLGIESECVNSVVKEEDLSEKPEIILGAFAKTSEPDLEFGSRIAVSNDRKLLVEQMRESKQSKPCFYLRAKVDVTDLMQRGRSEKKFDKRIWLEGNILRAFALGMKEFEFFGSGDCRVELGLITEGGKGPVMVKVSGAVEKKAVEIAEVINKKLSENNDLVFDKDVLDGVCLTVTDVGSAGVESIIPILMPGQSVAAGVGKMTQDYVPVEGSIVLREYVNMALALDHRIINGAQGGEFLDFVRNLLEKDRDVL